jgi:gliding motility-associated-like protein
MRSKMTKNIRVYAIVIVAFLSLITSSNTVMAQVVGPYTGIDYATDFTNPDAGGACDLSFINAAIGDADFVNGAAEVPLGWSFSGTWNSGTSYMDGPGDEVLLVSLHTYTESWQVALRLSDGSTTAFAPYDLTLVTSNATGDLATCGFISPGPYDYERPSQLLDFADFAIPGGVGVIGIIFEPFADGAANPDPHGILILEGTPILEDECDGPEPTADAEFVVGGLSSKDGATGACYVTPVQFNDLSTVLDPGVIAEWDWDFGDGGSSALENPSHTYGAPGTYTITLTVTTEGGCVDTYEFVIVMTEGLTLEIISNEPTCFGFTDGSVTVNVIGGTGELIFEITDEDGNVLNIDNSNTANELSTGNYFINVSDDSDCGGIASIFLDQPDEMDMELTVTDPLCYGFETGWARVDTVYNATGAYDQISFFWNPNPAGNGGLGEDSTWALGAGDYVLTINDENGCTRVFDFVVEEPDSLYFVEFGTRPAYCRLYGYQNGNGVVFGSVAGGTPDYDYLWTNLETGATNTPSTWGGLNPGNYEFVATDANGCILTKTVFLDSLNPNADFTVNSDQLNFDNQGTAPVEVVFVNTSTNFSDPTDPLADTTFFWNLDTPTAVWQISEDWFETFDTTYSERGQTYTVDVCLVAINKNGCKDTTCKILTIYEPLSFQPINIFSPNGDGANDIFTFSFTAKSISEFNCVIVDRWGTTIHEIIDVNAGWDGKDKGGNLCHDGVYFYVYTAKTDNSLILEGQGTIQLIGGK